jgi:hypothetical protein
VGDIKTHKDLIVWQKSVGFVTNIYKFTSSMPMVMNFQNSKHKLTKSKRCSHH